MAVRNNSDRDVPFGWCITGHHSDCRVEYLDWNDKQRSCCCDCHNKPSKRAKARNSNNK